MTKKAAQSNEKLFFQRLVAATAIMTYLLIVVGGIVRVTGSGLGCPDWPKCFGNWIPPLRVDAIIEYTHRLTATLTSPLILASAYFAWKKYPKENLISRPLIMTIFLLGIQGLLGGIVVMMETPPDLVAVHLGNALLIFALILLPYFSTKSLEGGGASKLEFRSKTDRLTTWTMVMIFLVLISGAIVAGSGSTYACAGWPLCNGQLIPASSYAWVHMAHRSMVLLASFLVVKLYLDTRRAPTAIAKLALTGLILFLTQAAIGAVKVMFGFNIWMLGFHVAVAAAVWAAFFSLWAKTGLQRE